MNDLYRQDEWCMQFTNEEIIEHLVKPLEGKCEVVVNTVTDIKAKMYTGEDKIDCVFFDGDKENFCASFYDNQTSIFISDEQGEYPNRTWTFNEDFMFIDDVSKLNYTSSSTSDNVVYEGLLRNKTHAEILNLLYRVVLVLTDAQKIKIEETVVMPVVKEDPHRWYARCKYIVKVDNNSGKQETIVFDNITFVVNGG